MLSEYWNACLGDEEGRSYTLNIGECVFWEARQGISRACIMGGVRVVAIDFYLYHTQLHILVTPNGGFNMHWEGTKIERLIHRHLKVITKNTGRAHLFGVTWTPESFRMF